MTVHRLFTLCHKWLTLIIGIQVVLWIAGGVVMSFFDIDKVRGSHNVKDSELRVFSGNSDLMSPARALDLNDLEATRITTRFLLDKPVYEVSAGEAGTVVLDAATGDKLSPVNEVTAEAIARADFKGDDDILSVHLLEEAGYEYRGGPLPVWQIVFADKEATRLYISANHGRVMARRNGTWRFYDFFWMLHIMDYDERDDFNHPLLVFASLLALFAALSGVGLYFYRFRKRDFRWVLPSTKDTRPPKSNLP